VGTKAIQLRRAGHDPGRGLVQSAADIAAELECGERTVQGALTLAGIRLPEASRVRRRGRRPQPVADPGWLRHRHVDQGVSVRSIAAELGRPQSTVRKAFRAAGIATVDRRRRYPQLADHTWLRRRYLDQAASVADMVGELGCHETSVYKALAVAGLPLRSQAQRPPGTQ
jgi:hypothetical protein